MYPPIVTLHHDVLDRYAYYTARYIEEEVAEKMGLAATYDIYKNDRFPKTLVEEVRYAIYGKQLDVLRYSSPINWKESVKDAWYKWMQYHFEWIGEQCQKKWPVQRKHIEYDIKALYPDIAVREPRYIITYARLESIRRDTE